MAWSAFWYYMAFLELWGDQVEDEQDVVPSHNPKIDKRSSDLAEDAWHCDQDSLLPLKQWTPSKVEELGEVEEERGGGRCLGLFFEAPAIMQRHRRCSSFPASSEVLPYSGHCVGAAV